MKRSACALALVLCVLLSGCASMLNQTYVQVEAVEPHSVVTEDDQALRVETYQELVNGIHDLVAQRVFQGTVRMVNYKGDPETDLAAACREVAVEDPLGAYAVDDIQHDYVHVVSYYEAKIDITYRRTATQMRRIVPVTGSSAIRGALKDALGEFATETVLRVSYCSESSSTIQAMIRQAYYEVPAAALGMPTVEVSIYPSDTVGYERIVEVQMTYPRTTAQLRRARDELTVTAEGMSTPILALRGQAANEAIFNLLRRQVVYQSAGTDGQLRNTAWWALVDGTADSEGIALAAALLCRRAGLESQVVSGTLNGTPHFWLVVKMDNGEYRHLDATRDDGCFLTDEELLAKGYLWDAAETPVCASAAAVAAIPGVAGKNNS